MNTIQLVVAVTGFVSILAAIIAGTWLNQRGLERLIEAFRNEMKAELRAEVGKVLGEIGTLRGEIGTLRGEIGTLRGEIGTLRAEVHARGERIERIERQLEAIFKPVLPGKGD